MPAHVKRDLRLDRDHSWIVLTEMNRFDWPGPNFRPVGGDGDPFYGAVPDWLLVKVRSVIGERERGGTLRETKRGE